MITAASFFNVACAANTAGGAETRGAVNEFFKQLSEPSSHLNIGLGYWIELVRNNKKYRCNNKIEFKSGDQIDSCRARYGWLCLYRFQKNSHLRSCAFPGIRRGSKGEFFRSTGMNTQFRLKQLCNLMKVQQDRIKSNCSSRIRVDPIAAMKAMRNSTTCFVAAQEAWANDLFRQNGVGMGRNRRRLLLPKVIAQESMLSRKP